MCPIQNQLDPKRVLRNFYPLAERLFITDHLDNQR